MTQRDKALNGKANMMTGSTSLFLIINAIPHKAIACLKNESQGRLVCRGRGLRTVPSHGIGETACLLLTNLVVLDGLAKPNAITSKFVFLICCLSSVSPTV